MKKGEEKCRDTGRSLERKEGHYQDSRTVNHGV
jgi:hypothetical protein